LTKKISLITSWGNALGTGHIQRMITLLWYFNTNNLYNTEIILKKIPPFFPNEFKNFIKETPSPDTDLIIRDMKNSTIAEIKNYGKKIIAIDDAGPGRYKANYAIDLLPNLINKNVPMQNIFIYGYTFVNTTNKLRKTIYKKDIDFTIYPMHGNNEYAVNIIKYLPTSAKVAVLLRNDSYIIQNNIIEKINDNFASIIFRTNVLISHFGILLYEAYISSCKLIAINPTNYCYNLANCIKDKMLLANFKNFKNINKKIFSATISNINISENTYISSESIYTKIILNIKNFTNHIKNFL